MLFLRQLFRGFIMSSKSKYQRKVYWGAFILDWFKYLQDNDLTSSDYKVLFYLCENMEFKNNTVYLKQKNIADKLNMDKGNVSKCIKRLSIKQFIVKVDQGYMINPHLFYVGKRDLESREELREIFDEIVNSYGINPKFRMNEIEYKLEKSTESECVFFHK